MTHSSAQPKTEVKLSRWIDRVRLGTDIEYLNEHVQMAALLVQSSGKALSAQMESRWCRGDFHRTPALPRTCRVAERAACKLVLIAARPIFRSLLTRLRSWSRRKVPRVQTQRFDRVSTTDTPKHTLQTNVTSQRGTKLKITCGLAPASKVPVEARNLRFRRNQERLHMSRSPCPSKQPSAAEE